MLAGYDSSNLAFAKVAELAGVTSLGVPDVGEADPLLLQLIESIMEDNSLRISRLQRSQLDIPPDTSLSRPRRYEVCNRYGDKGEARDDHG